MKKKKKKSESEFKDLLKLCLGVLFGLNIFELIGFITNLYGDLRG